MNHFWLISTLSLCCFQPWSTILRTCLSDRNRTFCSNVESLSYNMFPFIKYPKNNTCHFKVESINLEFHSSQFFMFPDLEYLEFIKYRTNVSVSDFRLLPSLKNLKLYGINLYFIHPLIFIWNEELISVNLSNILFIHQEYLISDVIAKIDLSFYNFQTIPVNAFKKLINFRFLHSQGNMLINVLYIKWLVNLFPVNIANNRSRKIPKNSAQLKLLCNIHINGNRLRSSCELKLIKENLIKKNITKMEPISRFGNNKSLRNISDESICPMKDYKPINKTRLCKRSIDLKHNTFTKTIINSKNPEFLNIQDGYEENDFIENQFKQEYNIIKTMPDPKKPKLSDNSKNKDKSEEADDSKEEDISKTKYSEYASFEELDDDLYSVEELGLTKPPSREKVIPNYILTMLAVILLMMTIILFIISLAICLKVLKTPPKNTRKYSCVSYRKNNQVCGNGGECEVPESEMEYCD